MRSEWKACIISFSLRLSNYICFHFPFLCLSTSMEIIYFRLWSRRNRKRQRMWIPKLHISARKCLMKHKQGIKSFRWTFRNLQRNGLGKGGLAGRRTKKGSNFYWRGRRSEFRRWRLKNGAGLGHLMPGNVEASRSKYIRSYSKQWLGFI